MTTNYDLKQTEMEMRKYIWSLTNLNSDELSGQVYDIQYHVKQP